MDQPSTHDEAADSSVVRTMMNVAGGGATTIEDDDMATGGAPVADVYVDFQSDDLRHALAKRFKLDLDAIKSHPTRLCTTGNVAEGLRWLDHDILKWLHPNLLKVSKSRESWPSHEQLYGIAMAARATLGSKSAFLCGDKTGVGKTRQILYFLLNCMLKADPSNVPWQSDEYTPPFRTLVISKPVLFEPLVKEAQAIHPLFGAHIYPATKISKSAREEAMTDSARSKVNTSILYMSHNVLGDYAKEISDMHVIKWLFNYNMICMQFTIELVTKPDTALSETTRFAEAVKKCVQTDLSAFRHLTEMESLRKFDWTVRLLDGNGSGNDRLEFSLQIDLGGDADTTIRSTPSAFPIPAKFERALKERFDADDSLRAYVFAVKRPYQPPTARCVMPPSDYKATRPPVVVIDEAHTVKQTSVSTGSTMGRAAKRLLKAAHHHGALCFLASATIASKLADFELFASVCNLCGSHPDANFNTFESMRTQMERYGVSGLESMVSELSSEGKYVSRSLSMKGVSMTSVNAEISPEQVQLYDAAARLWARLQYRIHQCAGKPNVPKTLGKGIGARRLDFFKSLLCHLKLPTVIEHACQAIRDNKSVMLTCITTDEAALKRATSTVAAADDDDDDASIEDSTDLEFSQTYTGEGALVDTFLCFAKNVEAAITTLLKPDASSDNDWIHALKAEIAEMCETMRALPLPRIGLMDRARHEMLRALPAQLIGEVSGRTLQRNHQGEYTSESANSTQAWSTSMRKRSNQTEIEDFQADKTRVLVVTRSGFTGASMHDVNGKHQRVLLIVEPPWSPELAVQQLGRVKRTGEKSSPEIVLVGCSGVKADMRMVAPLAQKIALLGACSSGDAKAYDDLSWRDFAMFADTLANSVANDIIQSRRLGRGKTARDLLNYALASEIKQGNAILEQFETMRLKMEATNGFSTRTVTLDNLNWRIVKEVQRVSSTGRNVTGSKCIVLEQDRGISWQTALSEVNLINGEFYLHKDAASKVKYCKVVFARRLKNRSDYMVRFRPSGTSCTEPEEDFFRNHTLISKDDYGWAKEEWDRHFMSNEEDALSQRFKYTHVVTFPFVDLIGSGVASLKGGKVPVRYKLKSPNTGSIRSALELPPDVWGKLTGETS